MLVGHKTSTLLLISLSFLSFILGKKHDILIKLNYRENNFLTHEAQQNEASREGKN